MGIPYAEVIGDPIAHSKSPLIHRFWLEKLRIEGDYRAVRVTAEDLPAYFRSRCSDPDWRGCNVTMPHKEAAIPLLDHADDPVVNCVTLEAGSLVGFNSDYDGVDEAVEHWGFCPDGARVCIIGAGGAAWAAVESLDLRCYGDFDIVVRDPVKGEAFLEKCQTGGRVFSIDDAEEAMAGRYAIINASPLGMIGHRAMPDTVLRGLARMWGEGYAFDMVTAPLQTPFLARARSVGLCATDGLSMLIGQARAAFHAFFGEFPPWELDGQLRRRLKP